MGQAVLTNNASTTLSVAISTTGQTSATVVDAANFPIPTGGDYFYATLLDSANIPEIVKVTGVAGPTFTIERAQDGTTARTFTTGASVRLALNRAVMAEFGRDALVIHKSGDTYTGSHDMTGASVAVATPVSAANPATKAYADALALGASGASLWVSGTTYALGNPVISPMNVQLYRRLIPGAGTTDPSLDPVNWSAQVIPSPASAIFLANNFGAL